MTIRNAPVLSNALADLAERVKVSVAAQKQAESTAATEALAAGALLVEAREQTTHGAWLPFLARAGVHERQAQRLMKLSRSGLKPDTVSDLGGVKAALIWLSGIRLPGPGQALLASIESGDVETDPIGIVVPAKGFDGFDFARVNGDGEVFFNKRSVTAAYITPVLLRLMRDRLTELRFDTFDEEDDDSDWSWGDLIRGEGVFAGKDWALTDTDVGKLWGASA